MTELADRIQELLRDRFGIEVASTDVDLINEGVLNSLVFMELIMTLEQEFNVTVSADDFEFDKFRTVERICAFAASRSADG